MPLDPITTIIGAFRSHDIVALGEGAHGNEQGHTFRLALIRDPRFSAVVNDIVVEFGNARYQGLMDRFVRGENVPDTALRDVWQNTTQVTPVWDKPIYEEFFRTVRAVNAKLAQSASFACFWEIRRSIGITLRPSRISTNGIALPIRPT